MSEVRKRSRKSKLEVRDDDCDYEVVNEENDETKPHLQVGVDQTVDSILYQVQLGTLFMLVYELCDNFANNDYRIATKWMLKVNKCLWKGF